MGLNINNITPASEKAKNVATETYVDSAVAAVDVSGDIADNNELFAQKLGYADYAAMVAAAASGQTVINGGYINTDLISANAITANQINTTGLIADNINATDIIGKNIYGAYIEGARINGAVIRASYLDLDGELEVLTDYHIPVATYNANPSLYTDAVYLETDNEYRIPTSSTVREGTQNIAITDGSSMSGVIWSYNKGNAGTNIKARQNTPTVDVSVDVPILTITDMARPSATASFRVYVGGLYKDIVIVSGAADSRYALGCGAKTLGTVTVGGTVLLDNPSYASSGTLEYTFIINNIEFGLAVVYAYSCYQTVESDNSSNRYANIMDTDYYFTIKSGSYTLSQSYTNTTLPLIKIVNTAIPEDYACGLYGSETCSGLVGTYQMNNSLLINNMN